MITLTPDDARLALTLPALSVAGSGERADGVAVAQQAGVAALGTVVVVLEKKAGGDRLLSNGSFVFLCLQKCQAKRDENMLRLQVSA